MLAGRKTIPPFSIPQTLLKLHIPASRRGLCFLVRYGTARTRRSGFAVLRLDRRRTIGRMVGLDGEASVSQHKNRPLYCLLSNLVGGGGWMMVTGALLERTVRSMASGRLARSVKRVLCCRGWCRFGPSCLPRAKQRGCRLMNGREECERIVR